MILPLFMVIFFLPRLLRYFDFLRLDSVYNRRNFCLYYNIVFRYFIDLYKKAVNSVICRQPDKRQKHRLLFDAYSNIYLRIKLV